MNDLTRLLLVVDAYARATGHAEATISTRFFRRGSRLAEIRGGRDMGARMIVRVLADFSQNWPEGAEWPADVPRPGETLEAAE